MSTHWRANVGGKCGVHKWDCKNTTRSVEIFATPLAACICEHYILYKVENRRGPYNWVCD